MTCWYVPERWAVSRTSWSPLAAAVKMRKSSLALPSILLLYNWMVYIQSLTFLTYKWILLARQSSTYSIKGMEVVDLDQFLRKHNSSKMKKEAKIFGWMKEPGRVSNCIQGRRVESESHNIWDNDQNYTTHSRLGGQAYLWRWSHLHTYIYLSKVCASSSLYYLPGKQTVHYSCTFHN